MDRYQQESVNDIENTLKNIDARLQGKTRVEQERIINDERDNLMSIVRDILSNRIPLIGGFLGWCTAKLGKFLGYDPFAWLHFKEYDHNAQFADRASSDPHLFNALMRAGEIFENAGSRYLSKKSEDFHKEVTTVSDANALAESIISFCRFLLVLNGQRVVLDPNDVKSMLAETIKSVLNFSNAEQEIKETCSCPIVQPSVYAWVKYNFSSNGSVESSCCSERKFVKVNVNILYYYFPNEAAFRQVCTYLTIINMAGEERKFKY